MIHFLVPRSGGFTIGEYLESRGRGLADFATVLHYEDLLAGQTLPVGTYVFAALDQLYPADRAAMGRWADALVQAGARVLNSPRDILLRLELLEELSRRGLNRHTATRADGDWSRLRFPVFLREEHRHTGALTSLLQTSSEVQAALARALIRGHRLKDLLVVEFCDCVSPDGFFRKYSAFAVGSQILPKNMAHRRHWMVKHGESEFTSEMILEERAYVFGNPHEHELRRLFDLARVDYGRIDYSLKDGAIETWEINTNPAIGAGLRSGTTDHVPSQLEPLRQPAKEQFDRLFQAAFEAVDSKVSSEAVVAFSKGALARPIVTRDEHAPDRFLKLRKWLRPLRSFIDQAAGTLAPVLLRLARRD